MAGGGRRGGVCTSGLSQPAARQPRAVVAAVEPRAQLVQRLPTVAARPPSLGDSTRSSASSAAPHDAAPGAAGAVAHPEATTMLAASAVAQSGWQSSKRTAAGAAAAAAAGSRGARRPRTLTTTAPDGSWVCRTASSSRRGAAALVMRTPPVMPDGMNDGPQSQPKEKVACAGSCAPRAPTTCGSRSTTAPRSCRWRTRRSGAARTRAALEVDRDVVRARAQQPDPAAQSAT